jgi:hypothetical protein
VTRNVGLRKENHQSNRDTEIEIDFCLALLLEFAMPGTSGAQVAPCVLSTNHQLPFRIFA